MSIGYTHTENEINDSDLRTIKIASFAGPVNATLIQKWLPYPCEIYDFLVRTRTACAATLGLALYKKYPPGAVEDAPIDGGSDGTGDGGGFPQPGGNGGAINYSTVEQDTGLLWHDGRIVFQRTWYPLALPAVNTSVDIPHGIENFGGPVEIQAFVMDYNGPSYIPVSWVASAGSSDFGIWMNSETAFRVRSGNWLPAGSLLQVTMRYVKSGLGAFPMAGGEDDPIIATLTIPQNTPAGWVLRHNLVETKKNVQANIGDVLRVKLLTPGTGTAWISVLIRRSPQNAPPTYPNPGWAGIPVQYKEVTF